MAKKKAKANKKKAKARASSDPIKMAAKVFATMPGEGKGKPKLRLSR